MVIPKKHKKEKLIQFKIEEDQFQRFLKLAEKNKVSLSEACRYLIKKAVGEK